MAAEQASTAGLGRPTDGDSPYAGLLGRTRSETVQVLLPDGHVRALSVYTGIDAIADPALAALARAGTLHHVAHDVELAIPFTYHDALARVFVLVVPDALRHRALALRAEHMLALAADTAHAPPSYVRDLEVVVGARGLGRRLELGAADAGAANGLDRAHGEALRALREKEQELARRERLLDARERALRADGALVAVRDSDIEELADADDDGYEEAVIDEEDDDEEGPFAPHAVSGEYAEIVDLSEGDAALEDDEDAIELDDRDEISILPSIPEPPQLLLDDPSEELALVAADGRAWLFVRERLEFDDPELLIQLDPALEPPVVVVTLAIDRGDDEPRRTVLDLSVPEQREALHHLAHHFEAEVVLFDGRVVEHLARVEGPREGNVRAILAHLARSTEPVDREAWERAQEIARRSIPARDPSHPFQGGELVPPITATEAAVLLDELADWLAVERMARVRLLFSVPDQIVDATYRSGISHGLDWGLSLTRELAAKALELGIEKDEAALLARRIEGLCRTSRASDLGGLEEGVLRAEWSEALEQAARLGVTLGDEARELATRHAGERAVVHAAALSDARDASLDPLRARAFGDPADIAALEELLVRGGYRDLLECCRMAHKLPPEDAARLFAHAARRGDPAALDALLSLLSFAEPLIVRAGAALSLSSRRALNALDELVAHVARASDSEYGLFALALGRYGAGSFRAIARSLKLESVEPERAALVYAHLALHGARAQVRTKARARERKDAQLAERALTLASELKDGKKPALALEQQGPLTVFCEVFDRLARDPEG